METLQPTTNKKNKIQKKSNDSVFLQETEVETEINEVKSEPVLEEIKTEVIETNIEIKEEPIFKNQKADNITINELEKKDFDVVIKCQKHTQSTIQSRVDGSKLIKVYTDNEVVMTSSYIYEVEMSESIPDKFYNYKVEVLEDFYTKFIILNIIENKIYLYPLFNNIKIKSGTKIAKLKK